MLRLHILRLKIFARSKRVSRKFLLTLGIEAKWSRLHVASKSLPPNFLTLAGESCLNEFFETGLDALDCVTGKHFVVCESDHRYLPVWVPVHYCKVSLQIVRLAIVVDSPVNFDAQTKRRVNEEVNEIEILIPEKQPFAFVNQRWDCFQLFVQALLRRGEGRKVLLFESHRPVPLAAGCTAGLMDSVCVHLMDERV